MSLTEFSSDNRIVCFLAAWKYLYNPHDNETKSRIVFAEALEQ